MAAPEQRLVELLTSVEETLSQITDVNVVRGINALAAASDRIHAQHRDAVLRLIDAHLAPMNAVSAVAVTCEGDETYRVVGWVDRYGATHLPPQDDPTAIIGIGELRLWEGLDALVSILAGLEYTDYLPSQTVLGFHCTLLPAGRLSRGSRPTVNA